MAESEKARDLLNEALIEMMESIHSIPMDCNGHTDLFECRNVVNGKVRDAAPAFVASWAILKILFSARACEQVIDALVDLALKAKCPMMYLTRLERSRLSEAGLSPREQLILGRLRERLKDEEAPYLESSG